MIVPDAAPATEGANCPVSVVEPPPAIVWPEVMPLTLNPAPDAAMPSRVMVDVPEFVSVKVCVLLLPTCTSLKLKLPGLAVNVLPAATALPVIVSVCGESCALSVKRMLPLTPAVDCGVNCTLNVADVFGVIVAGIASPLMLKPVPEIDAALKERFVFPLLLNVTL